MSRLDAYIGIDPGMSGALALYVPADDGPPELKYELRIEDMPVLKADGGSMLDHWRLATVLDGWRTHYYIQGVALERVSAMPDQGVTSSFNFGASFGAVKQAVASAGLHFTLISPATWKAIYGLRGGRENKAASAEKAIALFPAIKPLMYGPRGGVKDGRAEAVLLAHYGSKLRNA